MVIEEAINELNFLKKVMLRKEEIEALDMAISALSEQKSLKERMEQLYLEESLKEDLENLIKENERLRNALSENKGEWIADVDKWGDVVTTVNGYTCSKCGVFNSDKDNFCPNCGADMRGE